MKKNLFLILFALVLSITAAAQETIFPTQFKATSELNKAQKNMIVRIAEIEVYPQYLKEYL